MLSTQASIKIHNKPDAIHGYGQSAVFCAPNARSVALNVRPSITPDKIAHHYIEADDT